jgi:uncharacterized membrane protein
MQGSLRPAVARADCQAAVFALAVHEHKAAGIPELVTEISVAFASRQIEVDVASRGCQAGKGKPQRIGTEGGYSIGVLLAGLLFDLCGLLRIHQARGAFGHQRIERDPVY